LTSLDELAALIRARMAAAARDKLLYDRDGARLNGQLLQGEINMGTAVLAWIERARTGVATTADAGEDEDEVTGD
jgi:hypothetical protein